ncbi:hypothetical protein BDV23DRAFT_184508 [Aspergillus alliaceus]|uniref:Uncharacterized protein n=1 Tax=Petromyces alliaceus TaxID=209559 RepID=A0A5N7C5T6_PETAA|nr:hypothetical protein BDV23DRAFT_184508 [Aspergillus alliaceus]
MVLSLHAVYKPGDGTTKMKVNRDGAEAILSPYDTSLSFEQRRAEPPPHRTSVSFADIHDIWTTGSIELEDIDRQLVITHDIEGGCLTVPVDGNKDFDMYFTEDGFLELKMSHSFKCMPALRADMNKKMPHPVRYSDCIAAPGNPALGQSQKQGIEIGSTKSVAGDSDISSKAMKGTPLNAVANMQLEQVHLG